MKAAAVWDQHFTKLLAERTQEAYERDRRAKRVTDLDEQLRALEITRSLAAGYDAAVEAAAAEAAKTPEAPK